MSLKEESSPKKKVSPEQLAMLVNFMAENIVMVHGKTKPLEAERKLVENLWEEVTGQLNAFGNGPSKTSSQWKKTFIDWKCHTKKKARDYHKGQQKTGGGTSDAKELTENEKKLMSLITWISVEGAEVEEVGLGSSIDLNETLDLTLTETTPDPHTLRRPGSPIDVQRKKFHIADGETSRRYERKTGKASNLQNAAEAFEAGNKYLYDTIKKIVETNASEQMEEFKKKELELKENELKMRLVESRNKTRELDLLERKLILEERKLLLEEQKFQAGYKENSE